jgi:hypothetical protein
MFGLLGTPVTFRVEHRPAIEIEGPVALRAEDGQAPSMLITQTFNIHNSSVPVLSIQ